MNSYRIPADTVGDLCRKAITVMGSAQQEARMVADHLVEANLRGHTGSAPTRSGFSAGAGRNIISAALKAGVSADFVNSIEPTAA